MACRVSSANDAMPIGDCFRNDHPPTSRGWVPDRLPQMLEHFELKSLQDGEPSQNNKKQVKKTRLLPRLSALQEAVTSYELIWGSAGYHDEETCGH